MLRRPDGICDCAPLQLTAPSQDLQEVQDPGEREGTQDPKEIKVLVNKVLQIFQDKQTECFICLQVIRDSQGCQDYQGRTLFKFLTECRRGTQVGQRLVNPLRKSLASQTHRSNFILPCVCVCVFFL